MLSGCEQDIFHQAEDVLMDMCVGVESVVNSEV